MQRTSPIIIHQLSFALPNGIALFNDLTFTFSHPKTGLVGRNGVGKSTLVKLIKGDLIPNSGSIQAAGKIGYVPQNPIVQPTMTVAGLLGVGQKLAVLQRIQQGSIAAHDFTVLNDDWQVAERVQQQLAVFGLDTLAHERCLATLSGGELTRLLLTQAFFSEADILLLDEPTNHLDYPARQQLYHAIEQWPGSLVVISHDRALLNRLEHIVKLSSLGIRSYGGNYAFYQQQKNLETAASQQQLWDAQKALANVQRSLQASKEKHEQRQAQGRQLRRSGSQAKIILNAMRERSTRSQGELLTRHEHLLEKAKTKLRFAKEHVEVSTEINLTLPATYVSNDKVLFMLKNVTFGYSSASPPLIENFNLTLQGPRRIALAGANGSGKTTLIRLILGELVPWAGKIVRRTERYHYLDQHVSLLIPELSVLENFKRLNPDTSTLQAHGKLAQFLFKNKEALKLVKDLSGGEKLRALLACVLLAACPPQLLILDEPTNHLDVTSVVSVESALKSYQGVLIVISHDQTFLENIAVTEIISAPFKH